jgi:hypothetical protein
VNAAAEIQVDPALVPGGIEHYLSRTLPDGGLIEFEQAPAGWLTNDGDVRRKPHRAYYFTAPERECEFCCGAGRVEGKTPRGRKCNPCNGLGRIHKRHRLPSVTTLLDSICPKPGLPHWSEARGIEGAVTAMHQGLITPSTSPADGVSVVRSNHLGAEAIRDLAADRGLNVHALLEDYMRTGRAPRLAEHPPEHHGYIQALTRFLVEVNPEPVAVEQLIADHEAGYAGRLDLRALTPRLCAGLITWDAKTQENAGIYSTAHVQVNLYERAAIKCGDEPADRLMIVVFAANGEYRMMPADHPPALVDIALDYYRAVKPIDSACESANRVERDSRKAAA